MTFRIVLACIWLGLATVVATDSQCENASCIVIQQCPKLYKILVTTPQIKANVDLLRSRHCGYEKRMPKVCCPAQEKSNQNLNVAGNQTNNQNGSDSNIVSKVDVPQQARKQSEKAPQTKQQNQKTQQVKQQNQTVQQVKQQNQTVQQTKQQNITAQQAKQQNQTVKQTQQQNQTTQQTKQQNQTAQQVKQQNQTVQQVKQQNQTVQQTKQQNQTAQQAKQQNQTVQQVKQQNQTVQQTKQQNQTAQQAKQQNQTAQQTKQQNQTAQQTKPQNQTVQQTKQQNQTAQVTKQQYEKAKQLLPSSCGQDSSNRIIGGTATEIDEFPWMVLLEYRLGNAKTTACGGVLISKRYVLTAAHCIKNPAKPTDWILHAARLGEYDTRTARDCITYDAEDKLCADEAVSVGIEERIIHESYNKQQQNDIALLRLARDVAFTNFIKPICLPAGSKVNANVTASGWGRVHANKTYHSNVKLKVSLPVVPKNKCEEKGPKLPLLDSQICAGGNKGKDTCFGDSGGPLMQLNKRPDDNFYKWESVGIVSYGKSLDCGLADWPAVYTNVSHYVPWILSKIRL